MDLTPLAPFGAEVRGWDPSRDLTDAEVGYVRDALAAHVLLCFRGHPVPTHAELARFALRFGDVAAAGEMYGIELAQREVLEVSNELNEQGKEKGVAGSGSIPWHTDYAFHPRPAKETFLEAYKLPPGGGPQTCFLDMYDAYETLPDELRSRVEGLVARHTLWAAGAYASADVDPEERAARERQVNPDLHYPDDGAGVPHPVVMTHPRTGRRSLYVSSFVRAFDGVEHEEGRALLDALIVHADQPQRHYCHTWQLGDLVVSDQLGTVHKRGLVRANEPRTMRQMSTLLPA
ncbi:MAG TPA: TauD/TfdA family dioxygenase [Acidimicrobiales bacterium]|nr:TauD/TfdA family dioxygenase [Acidimicrobiales bacterium]